MSPEEQSYWEKRFDRIESKQDKMVEALNVLARIDEKLISQQDAVSRGYQRMNTIEERLNAQKQEINSVAEKGRNNEASIESFKLVMWKLMSLGGAVIVGIVVNITI